MSMDTRRMLLQGCLLAALLAAASAASVVLVDSQNGAYIQSGPATVVKQSSLSALMAATTGLLPSGPIDAETSAQLEGILKPSPLRKPAALVALSIGGVSTDALSQLFPNRIHRTIDLSGSGCPAMAIVDGLTGLSAANPSAKVVVVDHAGVQNCEGECMGDHLRGLASTAGFTVVGNGLEGQLQLGDAVTLDLTQKEEKLFAVELASVYSGLKAELAAASKSAELQVPQDDVAVYEVTMMTLSALAKKHGQDSEVVAAATDAVVRLLKWAVQGFDAAFGGDVVFQVALLRKGPARVQTVSQLISWKDHTRRQLQQAAADPAAYTAWPGTPEQEALAAKMFSAKAAGYGSFILLLYFSLAAIWCMCYMPFKQDTLLYGSKKDQ